MKCCKIIDSHASYEKYLDKNDRWIAYENAVQALEHEGLDRSDAQAAVDLKFNDLYGLGWEIRP